MGPQLSLIRQTWGAGDQTWDLWVQDEWFIHYTTATLIPVEISCSGGLSMNFFFITSVPDPILNTYPVSAMYMGESSKFQKSWTFKIQILKLAVCLQSVNNFIFKWSIAQWCTGNKSDSEAIKILLIQHFEADFLWKVSLKILISGIILKTFTHVYTHLLCLSKALSLSSSHLLFNRPICTRISFSSSCFTLLSVTRSFPSRKTLPILSWCLVSSNIKSCKKKNSIFHITQLTYWAWQCKPRCCGLVCSLWLWHFLVIFTCFSW